jgi:hypothetical protein
MAEIGFGLPTVMGRDYSLLEPVKNFCCPDLFRRMFVYNDGVCGPCCGDWERKIVVGSVLENSIFEIWNGSVYKNIRKLHLSGRYFEIPVCRSCSVPHLSVVETD